MVNTGIGIGVVSTKSEAASGSAGNFKVVKSAISGVVTEGNIMVVHTDDGSNDIVGVVFSSEYSKYLQENESFLDGDTSNKTLIIIENSTAQKKFILKIDSFRNAGDGGIELKLSELHDNTGRAVEFNNGDEVFITFDSYVGASQTIAVRDELGIEQFNWSLNDGMRLAGFEFDLANKIVKVKSHFRDTVFISQLNGNDSTGTMNNPNNAFATFDAAVTYWKNNTPQPSPSFAAKVEYVFLDNSDYVLQQSLDRPFTVDVLTCKPEHIILTSDYDCRITFNSDLEDLYVTSSSKRYDILEYRLPKATIELSGANIIQMGKNDNITAGSAIQKGIVHAIELNDATKTLGSLSKESNLLIKKVVLNGSSLVAHLTGLSDNAYTAHGVEVIEVKANVVSQLINLSMGSSVKFHNCSNAVAVKIVNNYTNRCDIYHGNYKNTSTSTSEVQYIYSGDRALKVYFADNAVIESPTQPLVISKYNGTKGMQLYGDKLTVITPYFIQDTGKQAAEFVFNLRSLIVKKLCTSATGSSGRNNQKLVFNCDMVKAEFITNGIGFTNETPVTYDLLTFNGNCLIDASDVVDGATIISSQNKATDGSNVRCVVNGELKIINGTIDTTNIDIIKPNNINTY